MSSCVSVTWLWLLCLSACSVQRLCSAELCDGVDNDCDARIDEGFRDARGQYRSLEHCGACGVRCEEVFPSAAETVCLASGCAIARCHEGEKLAGTGACVADVPVACLPCASDQDCQVRDRDARCVQDALGSLRCLQPCAADTDCATGFTCSASGREPALCRPRSGACFCAQELVGASFGCELMAYASGRICPGERRCSEDGLSACEPVLSERCNDEDDDCDGLVDEDFRDAEGVYMTAEHCGACGARCLPLGSHTTASCTHGSCERGCVPGFVDVNGVSTDGCECLRSTARAPVVSGDGDCDGVIDPSPALIFVSAAGDDSRDGTTPERAVSSVTRGMALGVSRGRTVVVARGIYRERVRLLPGVMLVGGYSPDFTEHDAALYPVAIAAPPEQPGAAVLTCEDIQVPTYVADLSLWASDASEPGQGSTGLWLARCSDAVELHGIEVLAARGANGARGEDSSARLSPERTTLAALGGQPGSPGSDGGESGCAERVGGAAGRKLCGDRDVSGGAGGAARCAALSCSNDDPAPCGNAGCSDFTVAGVCDGAAVLAAAVPNPNAEAGHGTAPGAPGEASYDAPTNHVDCSFCDDNPSLPRSGGEGEAGRAGAAGAAGKGCSADLVVDASGRAHASAGRAGSDGADGSGGGGGTAGAGYAVIAATRGDCSSIPGAAGGGGGSGGCGAPGATGGGGGGASIGVLIALGPGVSSGPVLVDVSVITSSGGAGGDGGIGAAGGVGGDGGPGGSSHFWCARNGGRGGDGGPGGAAGGGGGGCGGPSYGVLLAYAAGDPAPMDYRMRSGVRVEVAGSPGRAGLGGFAPVHAGGMGAAGAVTEWAAIAR